MSAKLDLKIDQGTDFTLIITASDDDNEPIDLTDYEFTSQIRKTPSDSVIQAEFECTVLDQVTNKGEVQLFLSGSASSAIPMNEAQDAAPCSTQMCYDIRFVTNLGTPDKWLYGVINFNPEVTR